jgi:hypothetical protein
MAGRFVRHSLSTLAMATAVVCCVAATAQAQVELKWKFQQGQKLNLQLAQDMTIAIAVQGQAITQKIQMGMDLAWDVKQVDSQGVATIDQKFNRIRMTMEMPFGKLQVDTNDENAEGPAAQIAEQLKPLTAGIITQKLSPSGQVLEVKLDEKAKEALAANPQFKDMFGEDAMKQMFGQSMVALPEKPVNVGDTWDVALGIKTQFGEMKLDSQYTYQGMAEHNGKQMAKIGIKGTLKINKEKADPNEQTKLDIKDSNITGTAWFDTAAGRVADTDVLQKATMVVETGGQSLEPNITTDTKLQVKPAQ